MPRGEQELTTIARWYGSPAGRRAARLLAKALAPDLRGGPNRRLLALGPAAPVLTRIHYTFERRALVTPAPNGRWPLMTPSCALAADPLRLPFAEAMFDDLLLLHCLEHAESPKPLLREAWRVLAPAGRLVLVVPNRGTRWTWFAATPYGQGRHHAGDGLRRMLEETMFAVTAVRTALFAPPLAGLQWLEAPLARLAPQHGAVSIIVAAKADGAAPAMAEARTALHAARATG